MEGLFSEVSTSLLCQKKGNVNYTPPTRSHSSPGLSLASPPKCSTTDSVIDISSLFVEVPPEKEAAIEQSVSSIMHLFLDRKPHSGDERIIASPMRRTGRCSYKGRVRKAFGSFGSKFKCCYTRVTE